MHFFFVFSIFGSFRIVQNPMLDLVIYIHSFFWGGWGVEPSIKRVMKRWLAPAPYLR